MLKDMIVDITKDLLKFVAGFAMPIALIFVGAVVVGIGFKFEMVVLMGVGAVVSLCGIVWALILVLWHSGA